MYVIGLSQSGFWAESGRPLGDSLLGDVSEGFWWFCLLFSTNKTPIHKITKGKIRRDIPVKKSGISTGDISDDILAQLEEVW